MGANTTVALSDLDTRKIGLLTSDGLNSYLKVTYQVMGTKSLFVSHTGSEDKLALVAGNTYTYQNGDLFYEGSATYAAIEDNKTFFGLKHTNYLGADDTQLS